MHGYARTSSLPRIVSHFSRKLTVARERQMFLTFWATDYDIAEYVKEILSHEQSTRREALTKKR